MPKQPVIYHLSQLPICPVLSQPLREMPSVWLYLTPLFPCLYFCRNNISKMSNFWTRCGFFAGLIRGPIMVPMTIMRFACGGGMDATALDPVIYKTQFTQCSSGYGCNCSLGLWHAHAAIRIHLCCHCHATWALVA